MLEILYRIYQVNEDEEKFKLQQRDLDMGMFSSTSKEFNIELLMDCMICDSRDEFKQTIREMYGPSIPFKYSKKLKPGDVYCIIIGEHAYNSERYFNKVTFQCDNCGSTVETYLGRYIQFYDYELNKDFFNIPEYRNKRFCCSKCKESYKKRVVSELRPNEDNEFFVTKDMFSQNIAGYIYKITKKSTGQFYVGQTQYAPMFRWAEHMKTDRFPISNIQDYMFEVLDVVEKSKNILQVEKEWIQRCFLEDPQRSLNISQTEMLRKEISGSQLTIFDV